MDPMDIEHLDEGVFEEDKAEKSRFLTDEQRWGVVIIMKYVNPRLIEEKQPTFSYNEIARMLNIGSHKTVPKVYESYKETGDIRKQYATQNATKIYHSVVQEEIKEILKKDKKSSISDTHVELEHRFSTHISRSAVHLELHKMRLKYRLIKHIPRLCIEHKQERTKYANDYLEDDFEDVIFGDEVNFYLKSDKMHMWAATEDEVIEKGYENLRFGDTWFIL